LPSPACASRLGEMIGNSGLPLDAYGHRLSSLVLPGDGWRTRLPEMEDRGRCEGNGCTSGAGSVRIIRGLHSPGRQKPLRQSAYAEAAGSGA
jgi:hypothetical protein